MGCKTESGQVIAELILVVLMIGAIFLFIADRGILTRQQLATERFASSTGQQ